MNKSRAIASKPREAVQISICKASGNFVQKIQQSKEKTRMFNDRTVS